MTAEWTPRELPTRAPGKATRNGEQICPCAGWSRPVDDNFRAAIRGEDELDHAPLCDGHGEPTRGLLPEETDR